MFDVDQCSQHVACISETSCLRNIVRLTKYLLLDTTVYCHVDLDQLLNQAQLQSLFVALHMPTCQFDNWRNLYFVKIDQVLLTFYTYLEIARVPPLHHLLRLSRCCWMCCKCILVFILVHGHGLESDRKQFSLSPTQIAKPKNQAIVIFAAQFVPDWFSLLSAQLWRVVAARIRLAT